MIKVDAAAVNSTHFIVYLVHIYLCLSAIHINHYSLISIRLSIYQIIGRPTSLIIFHGAGSSTVRVLLYLTVIRDPNGVLP